MRALGFRGVMLASLRDAARAFFFSGGDGRCAASTTGYRSCKPSACADGLVRIFQQLPVAFGDPDNKLSGLRDFDAGCFVEVMS